MLKKNWYLFTPLLLVIIPTAIFFYYSANVGYNNEDAMNATKHFLTSGTRYPMEYSEVKFDRLQPGMEGGEVYKTMGKQPFERQDNDTRWVYALPKPGARAYHERVVIMARDSQNVLHVKELVKRFHVPGQ